MENSEPGTNPALALESAFDQIQPESFVYGVVDELKADAKLLQSPVRGDKIAVWNPVLKLQF
jgi:hypothetical protein